MSSQNPENDPVFPEETARALDPEVAKADEALASQEGKLGEAWAGTEGSYSEEGSVVEPSSDVLVAEKEEEKLDLEDEEEEVGQVAWSVTISAFIVAMLLVAPAIVAPSRMKDIVEYISATVIHDLGWYYTLAVVGFVAFAIYIAVSRSGDIVLGNDDDTPDYSRTTWFAMLFAAGMGIGLVFWGVSEPLSHFIAPPPGASSEPPDVATLAQGAMNTTFLHWGLSAWAIYVVVGVAVAYTSHRRQRPIQIRWILEPLLGEKRLRGWLGDLIDVTAVVGTLFGVATSLGFGAIQFSAGIEFLGLIKQSPTLLVIIVLTISILAALSVASGLDVGIKWLSNGNLVLGLILMVLVLVLGQPIFVMREFVQSLGQYVQSFIPLSFRTLPFRGDEGQAWISGWTTYYWGWWMSWSPFVGIFIARISRGRTVREFIVGVLAVPTLLTFLWFSILGGTALWQQIYGGVDLTRDGADSWTTTALFSMLENLPGGAVLTGLFLLLLVVFFVTSSDSASFVIGILSSGGSHNPPLGVRLFWEVMEAGIAILLLWVGATASGVTEGLATDGLRALQVLSILTALPFSVVMILGCVSMVKAFDEEKEQRLAAERALIRERLAAFVENAVAAPRKPRRWLPAESLYTAPRRKRKHH